jgi:hypothetical protein
MEVVLLKGGAIKGGRVGGRKEERGCEAGGEEEQEEQEEGEGGEEMH